MSLLLTPAATLDLPARLAFHWPPVEHKPQRQFVSTTSLNGVKMPRMKDAWDFLQSPAGSAAFNMALDEALLQTAAKRGRALLRVYAWEKPAVSFGYFQKFPAGIAGEYEVVRRPTGGGLVYHGDGVDTTYTVVAPPNHLFYRLTAPEAYSAIHRAVAAALENAGRVTSRGAVFASNSPEVVSGPTTRSYECFQNPVPGDVMRDGRKLAGGAQRRNKYGMLHQGSIAAQLTPAQVADGFTLELGIQFQSYSLAKKEVSTAEQLAREKYGTKTWNHRFT